MQYFWTAVIFYLVEYAHQTQHIMSIGRTEIAKIEPLEDVVVLFGDECLDMIGES